MFDVNVSARARARCGNALYLLELQQPTKSTDAMKKQIHSLARQQNYGLVKNLRQACKDATRMNIHCAGTRRRKKGEAAAKLTVQSHPTKSKAVAASQNSRRWGIL